LACTSPEPTPPLPCAASLPPAPQDPTTQHIGCGLATVSQLGTALAALEAKLAAAIRGLSNATTQANTTATDAAFAQLTQDLAALTGQVDALEASVAALNATTQQVSADTAAAIAALKVSLQQLAANTTAAVASLKAGLQQLQANASAGIAELMGDLQAVNASTSGLLRVGDAIDAATLGGVAPAGYVRVPTRVALYALGATLQGNLGGRAGADRSCQSDAGRPAGFLNARALLSVSSTDTIAAMPTLYGVPTNLPITSAAGAPIAANWADMLDGSLPASFAGAGVTTSAVSWTGATSSGGYAQGADCAGWSSASSGASGGAGDPTASSNGSYLSGFNITCDSLAAVICLVF
jgi:hypothetical protein